MSDCLVQRENTTFAAASSTMNSVAPRSFASVRNACTTSSEISNRCTAPADVRTAGRGRSEGRSTGGSPASFVRQWSS